ncbi:hypothetical protein [Aquisphaera insulae]|uniref:hypothetical protein n=1 Tax=Aquisphaera insulae TaxID=2712864 RepID=UPI0013EC9993|nr:hypothetical protein [Aquisphaera insulae]
MSLSLMLTLAMAAADRCFAQVQPGGQTKGATPGKAAAGNAAAGSQEKAKGDSGSQPADPGQPAAKSKEGDGPAEAPPDPSQTQKVSPVEIFKDPLASQLIDLKSFNPIRNRPPAPGDIEAVKDMAQNPAAPVDPTLIRRMVGGMIAQLTDTKNIQLVIDPPPTSAPGTDARAIETATRNLQEPLFVARANKSTQFLTEYNKALIQLLPPVLKNHLVPRVQAMIVLGQTGSPEAYKLFLDEIKNPKQTVWVKLWAFRGITNIIRYNETPRLNNQQTVDAARVISDFLGENKEVPWPVQYRALEALTYLRQGTEPKSPKEAKIASTVARILADPKARPDVRSEAARALGLMQITTAVTDYNHALVAYLTGQVAAAIGDEIVASYSEKGPALNATKAQYLATLLIGPIFQTFEGQAGVRDSGLLHNPAAASSRSEIQKVQDLITPLSKSAVDLVKAPAGQLASRRKDLQARVAAVRAYLAKNVPANGHLVPGDDGFLAGAEEPASPPEPASGPATAKAAGPSR